ncbi:MAG: phage regulatory CII family protein [Sulfurimonas sp.]
MLEDIFYPVDHIYIRAQKVVKDYKDKHSKKISWVAEELNTTKGYLYQQLDPNREGKQLSVDRVIHITKLTKDLGIIEAIADHFDCIMVKRMKVETETKDINMLVDISALENQDVFREAKKAIMDGHVDEHEREKLVEELKGAQQANAQLLYALENM